MSISEAYKEGIRGKLIREFVKQNSRAPSIAELKEIDSQIRQNYQEVDTIGITGYMLEKPKFKQISSASLENSTREYIKLDLNVFNTKLDKLIKEEGDSHLATTSSICRLEKALGQIDQRLDNLLIFYGVDKAFSYGVEEDFTNSFSVDLDKSTAKVRTGAVSLRQRRVEEVDLTKCKVSTSIVAPKGHLGFSAKSKLKTILAVDGDEWIAKVHTNYQSGRVSLVLTFLLDELTDISLVKLITNTKSLNNTCKVNIYYSHNDSNYVLLEPTDVSLLNNLIIPINQSGVSSLQLVLTKDAADRKVDQNWEYVFPIEFFGIEKSSFFLEEDSVLVCGPYDVYNTFGKPVYFTKCRLDTCSLLPEDTSITYQVSNNGVDWLNISPGSEGSNYVTFGDSTPDQAIDYIDQNSSRYSLFEEIGSNEEFDRNTEAYLNACISSDYIDNLFKANIYVERNIITDNKHTTIMNSPAGWVYDKANDSYSCVAYVNALEGLTIDFGPKSLEVNNKQVSGKVTLGYGYNVVKISKSNMKVLSSKYSSEEDLIKDDPLYPYNHYMLITGCTMSKNFRGPKVYNGVARYFGARLTYVSPEVFDTLNYKDGVNVFTLEQVDDKLYFKVKVDKSFSTWDSELLSPDFVVQSSESNQLWLKAFLYSSNPKSTPVLQSFKARVI